MLRRLVLLALLLGPATAEAQTAGRTYRVGALFQTGLSGLSIREIVIPELARQGFRLGQNLAVDFASGEPADLPRLAADFVAQKVDAILTVATPATAAALAATAGQPVPVVFYGGQDAVSIGAGASLSRPSTNATGVVILSRELEPKRLELLLQVMPKGRRFAYLAYSGDSSVAPDRVVRPAADAAGVELLVVWAGGPADYAAAFDRIAAWRADGLVIGAASRFFGDAAALLARTRAARLPTACEWAEMAATGCMIGYGPDRARLYRIAAAKLAQVLKGMPVRDIPIEQPAVFELSVNQAVAREAGIELPASLLARADHVVE